MSHGLRVVLGDDDGPARAAVREILGRDGCEVVAEAGSDGVAVVMLTDSERAEQPVADT